MAFVHLQQAALERTEYLDYSDAATSAMHIFMDHRLFCLDRMDTMHYRFDSGSTVKVAAPKVPRPLRLD